MSLMYGAEDYGGEHHESEGFYPGPPRLQIVLRDTQGADHEASQDESDRHRARAIRTCGYETWCSYPGEGRTYPEKPHGDREPGQ